MSRARKYRLTIAFCLTSLVVIATASLVVNHIIGRLSENHLKSIAEKSVSIKALHLESMIAGPHSVLKFAGPSSLETNAGPSSTVMDTGPSSTLTTVAEQGNGDGGASLQGSHALSNLSLQDLSDPSGLASHFDGLIAGLNIMSLCLIDLRGTVVWSSDPEAIDTYVGDYPPFRKAFQFGVTSSFRKDQPVKQADGSLGATDLVETYLPLRRHPSGEVIGIIRINSDVEDLSSQLIYTRSTAAWATAATMGTLFVVLAGFIVAANWSINRSGEREIALAANLARSEEVDRTRLRIITAAESVRREVAQELHGSIQSKLVILLFRLRELESGESGSDRIAALKRIQRDIEESLIGDVRAISHRLYPAILRQGLVPALRSLSDRYEASFDIESTLDRELVEQERRNKNLISEQVRLSAYRIAEEALTNVVKHANAGRVWIGLDQVADDTVALTIRDNGTGFEHETQPARLGLVSMQDSASLVGGECHIESSAEGTLVTVRLPLVNAGPRGSLPSTAQPALAGAMR